MSTFDDDDDVRRMESDELHGIAGGWYDKDPTPAHGTVRPVVDDRVPTTFRAIAQVWPDSFRFVEVEGVSL